MRKYRRIRKFTILRAVVLRERGLSWQKIGKILDRDQQLIRKKLIEQGFHTPEKFDTLARVKKIRVLRESGLSWNGVARRLGISQQALLMFRTRNMPETIRAPNYTEEQRMKLRIRRRRKLGQAWGYIAHALGMSERGLLVWLKQHWPEMAWTNTSQNINCE